MPAQRLRHPLRRGLEHRPQRTRILYMEVNFRCRCSCVSGAATLAPSIPRRAHNYRSPAPHIDLLNPDDQARIVWRDGRDDKSEA
jgi:hypothetical protein